MPYQAIRSSSSVIAVMLIVYLAQILQDHFDIFASCLFIFCNDIIIVVIGDLSVELIVPNAGNFFNTAPPPFAEQILVDNRMLQRVLIKFFQGSTNSRR